MLVVFYLHNLIITEANEYEREREREREREWWGGANTQVIQVLTCVDTETSTYRMNIYYIICKHMTQTIEMALV
jgi:hypothetical protein